MTRTTDPCPDDECYPKVGTYTWQEWPFIAVEMGGYNDVTVIDPWTGRRFWIGDVFDALHGTPYDALRRVVDEMEAARFLDNDEPYRSPGLPDEPSDDDMPSGYAPLDDDARQDILDMLAEVQTEPEIECAHCSGVPDGTLTIHTDTLQREHRICNACAATVLRWL